MQQPGERELRDAGPVANGGLLQRESRWVIRPEDLAGGDGVPGQEGDAALPAPCERQLMAAVGEAVAVLDRDDGHNLLRFFDLFRRDFAETDVVDLSLVLKQP